MRYAVLVLLGCALASLPHKALADSPERPEPCKTVVGDKDQYVFVMLPGSCESYVSRRVEMTDAEYTAFEAKEREERHALLQQLSRSDPCADLRASAGHSASGGLGQWDVSIESYKWTILRYRHHQSESGQEYRIYTLGLDPNDGPTTPLWTVEWYAFHLQTYLSRDGRYLVRMGPWASRYDDMAVAFYENGVILKEYIVTDLVRRPETLLRSVSHFMWEGEVSFDGAKNLFTIKTLNDEVYIFDVTSGEIVSREYRVIPSFNVKLHDKNNAEILLYSFESCSMALDVIERRAMGKDASIRLYGSLPQGENRLRYAIPFQVIQAVKYLSGPEQHSAAWEVTFKDGRSFKILVDESYSNFCGKDASGTKKILSARDIHTITFE